jgi:hypothetical protein
MPSWVRIVLDFVLVLAISALCASAVLTSSRLAVPTPDVSEFGCAFRVPPPAIARGAAGFTATVSCTPSPHSRKVEIELTAQDPSYDDVLGRTSAPIAATTRGRFVMNVHGWHCREDELGHDEVYVLMRIERHEHGAWQSGAWVGGPTTRGHCR